MTRARLWPVAALLLTLAGAQPALARTICVGKQSGCVATLAQALDQSADGDRVKLAPGTYDGGVTIEHSIALVGAGAAQTVIRGGGPVVTVGIHGAETEPTVSIDGVTITGGVTRSSAESVDFTGEEGVFAVGGGIAVPINASFDGGAKLRVSNSVIRGNRVAPSATGPSGGVQCPDGECPFAYAGGGGIDTFGDLTVVDSRVLDNAIGSASGLSDLASDVDGGGIETHGGVLTVLDSVVSGNQATAGGPNGRFAEGGGVRIDGTMILARTRITGNVAALHATLPADVDMLAIGGGIQIGGMDRVRVNDSAINHNLAEMTNSVGDAHAYSGGLSVSSLGDFAMHGTTLANNRVHSATVGASTGNADGDGGGGSPIDTSDSRVLDNTVEVESAAGDAEGDSGGILFVGRLVDSVLSGNRIEAHAPHGTASAFGGALTVAPFTDDEGNLIGPALAALVRSALNRNTASADGADSVAQGGGVFDGPAPFTDGAPLRILSSQVTDNAAQAAEAAGGGVYTRQPTTVQDSAIVRNAPDQCDGCAPTATRSARLSPRRGVVSGSRPGR